MLQEKPYGLNLEEVYGMKVDTGNGSSSYSLASEVKDTSITAVTSVKQSTLFHLPENQNQQSEMVLETPAK